MPNNTSLKGQGKGAFMKNQWNNMAHGQIAPSPGDIRRILNPKREYQYLYQMPIDELQDKIVDYFRSITTETVNSDTGEVIVKYKSPPSTYELALAIGFSQHTLMNYANGTYDVTDKVVEYQSNAAGHLLLIKKSIEFIRSFYEKKLSENGNPAGSCFWLKNNAGWKDEQTVTVKPADPMGGIKSADDLDKLTLPPAADEE